MTATAREFIVAAGRSVDRFVTWSYHGERWYHMVVGAPVFILFLTLVLGLMMWAGAWAIAFLQWLPWPS